MITSVHRAFASRAGFIARLVAVSKHWCPFCTNGVEIHPAFCALDLDNDDEKWKTEAAAVVQEALIRFPLVAMDATRRDLISCYGTPSEFAIAVVRAAVGHSCYVGSPAHLPDDVRRVVAAYWYRWQVAT